MIKKEGIAMYIIQVPRNRNECEDYKKNYRLSIVILFVASVSVTAVSFLITTYNTVNLLMIFGSICFLLAGTFQLYSGLKHDKCSGPKLMSKNVIISLVIACFLTSYTPLWM